MFSCGVTWLRCSETRLSNCELTRELPWPHKLVSNKTVCCVSGLQWCEECDGSRSGDSEAPEQLNHQHGVSEHRGTKGLLVPPAGCIVKPHLFTSSFPSDTVCSRQFQVFFYPEPGKQMGSSTPLWIIMVSVLAGVVLLALLCLWLWKVGPVVLFPSHHIYCLWFHWLMLLCHTLLFSVGSSGETEPGRRLYWLLPSCLLPLLTVLAFSCD